MELPELTKYDTISLDTETHGVEVEDKPQPVGLAIAAPDGNAWYLRWGHKGGGNNCTLEGIREWAARELVRPDGATVFHNAAFDLRMLAAANIPCSGLVGHPGEIRDTMIGTVLLDEHARRGLDDVGERLVGENKDNRLYHKLASIFGGTPTRKVQADNIWRASGDLVEDYALQDARLTLRVDERILDLVQQEDGLDWTYRLECELIPIVYRLHEQGVPVSQTAVNNVAREVEEALAATDGEWFWRTGGVSERSTKALIPILEQEGVEVPINEETGNPTLASAVLMSSDFTGNRTTDLMLERRQLKWRADTFVRNYMNANIALWDDWLDDDTAVIHGLFHQMKNGNRGTISGRFSSGGGLNLQNIPSRDPVWGPMLRGCFVPVPGHRWATIDYSQVEYRFLAHYGGGQLREAYRDNPDVDFHTMTAEMSGLDRKRAKNLNFAIVYGAGGQKLASMMGVTLERGMEFRRQYNKRIPEVHKINRRAINQADDTGVIRTWGERRRRFRERNGVFENTHKSLNALLQGSAADLLKLKMLEVARAIDWDHCIMHLTIHDELDFSVSPCEEGRRQLRMAHEIMEDVPLANEHKRMHIEGPSLTVPISCDVEVGSNWGDATVDGGREFLG